MGRRRCSLTQRRLWRPGADGSLRRGARPKLWRVEAGGLRTERREEGRRGSGYPLTCGLHSVSRRKK
uniref:Uncharacterized protein n=1 Tax=Setaria italica TaxID=4555 RepID=K3Y0P0_SETIT